MSTRHRLGLGAEACHDRFQYAHREVRRVVLFDGGDLLPEPGEGVAEGDESPRILLNEEQLLIEGRIDNVKKKYPWLSKKGLLDILIEKDPSELSTITPFK